MVNIPVAAAALISGVISPFYIYPGDDCAAWQPMFTALSDHPDLPFYVIVNPASGPGTATEPDSNYQACIPSLRPSSNLNVKVLGYVATGDGEKSPADVMADVDLYAGWGSAHRPDGIFFDQARLSTMTGDMTNYGDYAAHVRSQTWHQSGESFVVFNPGALPQSTAYYGFADMIVTFENFFATFDDNDLDISAVSPAAKQAVILHTGPSTPPTTVIDELVTQNQLGAVYNTDIPLDASTNDNPYGAFPTDWDAFLDAVESAQ